MFSVKDVAKNLQMTTQAIYKQKQDLISKGYMEKNERGNWEINEKGYNYLQDKKINFIQQHNIETMQPVANQQPTIEETKESEKDVNINISNNNDVLNLLLNQYKEQLQTVTNQLQEMTEQRNYFKAKFEEKDALCNQYINAHLLPPTEEEKSNIEKNNKNKSFFKRLFNRE